MFELFPVVMVIVSAIFLLVSVVAIQMGAKKIAVFMKVIKGVAALSIVIGIVDIIAAILWYLGL
jgi:hypothetical protein